MYLKPPGRKSKRPIKYDFKLQYYTLNRTAKELADYYGVKENTIYQWARQFRKEEEEEKKRKDPA